ncbi:MAG TPA: bifunctional phosphoglucose/phosphomannose isomerase [Egibacteraceae bacterium]|nr:bifunctional phosphoglucose/phosphomannose isomerase [Egibacteraceae bacterium]
MDLDQPDRFGAVDPADALGDVEATSVQWAAAPRPPRIDLNGVDSVLVTGVGGSGICADVVAGLAAERLAVPIVVHKTYGLPAHVGNRSLVVAVSCSGNTEETLSGAEEALRRRAGLLVVAGGGRLAELCEDRGHPWVSVPRAWQPRHSLGALAVPVLAALGLDDGLEETLAVQRAVLAACGRDVPCADNPVKRLGARIAEAGIVVVQGARPLASVAAYRLKSQLNENAKVPAFFGELPEVTHNEIVGWQDHPDLWKDTPLVLMRDPQGEHPRMTRRIGHLEDLAADHLDEVVELTAHGGPPLARLASLLMLADLTSIYAALARDCDPTPIALIDRLKEEMSRE